MPPLRRRSRVQDKNMGAEATLLNNYSVQQLRNLCRQKKIASTGNKATLLNRLRGSGPRVTVSNADARGRLQETNEMFGSVPVLPQDHVVNTNANDSTFSEGQLNTFDNWFRSLSLLPRGKSPMKLLWPPFRFYSQVPRKQLQIPIASRQPLRLSRHSKQQVHQIYVNMRRHFRIFLLNT